MVTTPRREIIWPLTLYGALVKGVLMWRTNKKREHAIDEDTDIIRKCRYKIIFNGSGVECGVTWASHFREFSGKYSV